MRVLHLAVPLAIAFGLVGCGSEKAPTMPDVTSKKLDVAYDKIKTAGFDDNVEVDGGGLFGVVKESNWTVCKQTPAAGKPVSGKPKLTVDRSCDKGKKKSTKKPSSAPTDDPTPTATASATPAPAPKPTPKPKLPEILTAKNNAEFAALLKLDSCDNKIGRFAKKYAGHEIKFDGSIGAFAAYEEYKTRFNTLVGPGDNGTSAIGPAFQFSDMNAGDMNFSGNYPDNIEVGQNYTFTAEVGDYSSDTCNLQLRPVDTKAR